MHGTVAIQCNYDRESESLQTASKLADKGLHDATANTAGLRINSTLHLDPDAKSDNQGVLSERNDVSCGIMQGKKRTDATPARPVET